MQKSAMSEIVSNEGGRVILSESEKAVIDGLVCISDVCGGKQVTARSGQTIWKKAFRSILENFNAVQKLKVVYMDEASRRFLRERYLKSQRMKNKNRAFWMFLELCQWFGLVELERREQVSEESNIEGGKMKLVLDGFLGITKITVNRRYGWIFFNRLVLLKRGEWSVIGIDDTIETDSVRLSIGYGEQHTLNNIFRTLGFVPEFYGAWSAAYEGLCCFQKN